MSQRRERGRVLELIDFTNSYAGARSPGIRGAATGCLPGKGELHSSHPLLGPYGRRPSRHEPRVTYLFTRADDFHTEAVKI